MIDKTVPYIGVLMEKCDVRSYPRYALPKGYTLEPFRQGRQKAWANILAAAGLVEQEEALATFERSFGTNPAADRIWFVLAPGGEPAATCSLWDGSAFDPPRQRLHWVATHPAHQRKGLAKALISHVLGLYEGQAPLYLATQTWSWPAIRLYQGFGFRPYKGPKPAVWTLTEGFVSFEQQAEQAWAIIEEKLRRS